MSTGRMFLAALIGAVVVFLWSFVEHTFLPTAGMGVQPLPNEAVIVPTLRSNLPKRGIYHFPPIDMNDRSEAAEKAYAEKLSTGPQGIIAFDPNGSDKNFFPRRLALEFVSNLAAALLLAAVVAKFGGGAINGALIGAGFGLFAWLSIDVSYWNWYHFAGPYVIATLIEQGVGGLLGGLTIGLVIGRRRTAAVVP